MLEKIFELADKCNKRDTDVNKRPTISPEGKASYFIAMTHPFSDGSADAQDALLNFLNENCLTSSHTGFMHDTYHFMNFDVDVVFFDWGFGYYDEDEDENEDESW